MSACASHERFEGVSGYTRPVDWMGSALCEFTYIELLLGRGLRAPEAARQLVELLEFADDSVPRGSAIPASHFRFVGAQHSGQ